VVLGDWKVLQEKDFCEEKKANSRSKERTLRRQLSAIRLRLKSQRAN
jgi:hypothetical protein